MARVRSDFPQIFLIFLLRSPLEPDRAKMIASVFILI